MVGDNLSCLGTEALARLGLRLGGFQLMFQSSLSDGVAFDPFSFQKDGSASAEVDGKIARDVARSIIAEQSWFVHDHGAVAA